MILENEYAIIFSRKKSQRIMRKYGIAKTKKEHQVIPNKLKRKFKQGISVKVLLTDIT